MLKRYNDIGFERSVRKRLTQIRSVLEKKPVFGAEIAKLVIMFMITANLYQVWCGDATICEKYHVNPAYFTGGVSIEEAITEMPEDDRKNCSPANYMRKIPIMKRKTPFFNMRYCPNVNKSEINERKN